MPSRLPSRPPSYLPSRLPGRPTAAAVLLAALLLGGCGGDATKPQDAAPAGATDSAGAEALLAEHGLEGKDAKAIIEELDRAEEKPADLMASVRYDELQVSDPSEPEQVLSLPIEDDFYLSVAPYVDDTHDCYFHSLTTCQGELVEEDVEVRITDSDGEVLVDDTVTTYPNGFVGFWLPRDIEATLEVSYDGRTASTQISTGERDPTCLTTVRLA